MQMIDLEKARDSLGRGLARQAFEKAQNAEAGSAASRIDTLGVIEEELDLGE